MRRQKVSASTAHYTHGNLPRRRRSRGAALVVALLMLMVILMLGMAASESALQGLKTARNDGDRQVAMQAAEAALRDAEMDIEQSPDAGKSRSHIFSRRITLGFPAPGEVGCNGGAANIYLGLCRPAGMNALPVWQTVDFGEDAATARSVAYGTFTGQVLQVGKGALPSRLPRYIIELFSYSRPGESAGKPSYFYRITAVGFGAREATQVALQSFYRKEDE